MKNLLAIFALTLSFSSFSSAAVTFTCVDASNNAVRLTVIAPNHISLDTNFAQGSMNFQGTASSTGLTKFAGMLEGKESRIAFNSVILVSPALLTCKAVPHGFSLGSVVIQSNTTGQGQTFNCR